ncbi:MAG: ABC transporter permease [Caldiserica bacterium]|nr:ABC transporter permease [Caldisericota bacterium]
MGFVKLILRRKTLLFAVGVLLSLVVISIFAPYFVPYDPDALRVVDRLQPPSAAHFFGTDHFGRDIFSRVLVGTRVTFILGISISAFALVFGVPLGVLSGYYDRLGMLIMRIVDAIMAFPAIILALALMAIMGKPGMVNVIIAVGMVWAPRMVRVVYSSTLSLRENTYVEAARALGASSGRILVRHIAVNLLSPVIVQSTFTFAFSIMEVAALNFLGVGIPPYVPSWGGMMNEGRTYIIRAPWIIIFPGVFLALSVLSFNLLGDALRDRLDPKLRHLV